MPGSPTPSTSRTVCSLPNRKHALALAGTLLTAGCLGSQSVPLAPNSTSPAVGYDAKTRGLIFVANTYAGTTGEVDVLTQHDGKQVETITNGLYYPIGLGVDSAQNLYVANGGPHGTAGFVTEYAPPYTGAPTRTYTQGLQSNFANAVAVGTDGSVYVSEYSAGIVVVYPPNSTTPSAQLTFDDYPGIMGPQESGSPEGLALDASNDLYVALNFPGNASEVIKVKHGAQKGRFAVGMAGSAGGVTFDGAGDLLLERQQTYNVHDKQHMIPPAVLVFPAGHPNPSRKIDDHFAGAYALAFDRAQRRLFLTGSIIKEGIDRWRFGTARPGAIKERSAMYCISYPSAKPVYAITFPAGSWILGIAVTPPAPK